MEPPSNSKVPPDRARDHSLAIEKLTSNMTAAAVSLPPVNNQLVLYSDRPASSFTSISSAASTASMPSTAASSSSVSAPIEKLSRPMAFDKVSSHSHVHAFIMKFKSGSFDASLMNPKQTQSFYSSQ